MALEPPPDYSSVVSATGFLRPRASRSMSTFQDHLAASSRILALLGAGISAPSGLPTFRGVGALWRTLDPKQLSTPQAFEDDPSLVWTFYEERRQAAMKAQPNAAHVALAELAKRRAGFLAISMNIDDLSERAGHPPAQLHHLHGSLLDIKCSRCDYVEYNNRSLPFVPSSITPPAASMPDHSLRREDIPHCPNCAEGLLRPGVVWFSEALPSAMLKAIHTWIQATPVVDTMLVIGTSAEVYPATAYIEAARQKGARVAVFNLEQEDVGLLALEEQDWYFQGDAAALVPMMVGDGSF